MTARIAFVVQGLFELSDSIGYDCVGQYQMVRELIADGAEVRIFAETVRSTNHPGISIESVDRLWPWVESDPTATVIYHYCDGWAEFEARFAGLRCRKVVRWHNNTPPWFLAPYSMELTARSTRGFRNTLRLARVPTVEFWVNSMFSARQLGFLGVDQDRIRVVYPVSKFIGTKGEDAPAALLSAVPAERPGAARGGGPRSNERDGIIRILFVGRICPHKGYKHLIATCAILRRIAGRSAELVIAGRADPSLRTYLDEVRRLARELRVPLRLLGEVTDESLRRLYASCSVFLCLSEHEGFGLPVFEAMRMGVPVVAWRSTAVGDLLRFHPLGVDSLDYTEIARSVLAASDPAFRDAVVAWQSKRVLSAYNADVVAEQLLGALRRSYAWPRLPARGDEDAPERPPLPHRQAGPIAKQTPAERNALSEIARDIAERLMTRHDIDSYAALLERGKVTVEGDFFHRAMATKFQSNRPILGAFLRMVRRATLSTQSGIVSAVGMLEQDLFGKADAIETQLRELKGAIETLQAPAGMSGRMPEHSIARGVDALRPANGGVHPADEASFDEVAALYDGPYFNGSGEYSGYFRYTRDAVGPCRDLATALFEAFQPSSVLDVGCAVGYTVAALRERGVEAFGCDISEWAVREARSAFVKRLDIATQEIDGRFDLVLAYDVIDHIAPELLSFSVQNLWRATAGWLVVVPGLHTEGTTFDRSEPMHRLFHDRDWWQSFLERQCGVAVDRVATAALSNSDHSRTFGYQGRIFVLRKPHLLSKSKALARGSLALGTRAAEANGQARPGGAGDPARPDAAAREPAE
jgi:glycosyltransferase involved in cell wall biosynthesis/SAM-dependent methyltransferase